MMVLVAAIMSVGLAGTLKAETPTATTTVDATATATTPATQTSTPPTATPAVTPTPDPNHPLGLRFAPAGGAPPGSFAYPDVGSVPSAEGLETVLRFAPRTGTLAPEDAQRFAVGIAQATVAGQAFFSTVRYNSDAEFISVFSWTKTGDFEYVAPCCSPVSIARQTTIHGLPALTEVPSDAVVGGVGPVRVFFLHDGVIYFLDFSATQREEALAMADRAAAWITSRPPGPPATGTGTTSARQSDPVWVAALTGAALIVASFGWSLRERRRSH